MAGGRTLTVLLGAGASYDCADPDTNQINENYHPPLVKDLFSNSPSFNEILGKYPKASALSHNIRTRVNREESLEAILKEMASKTNIFHKQQYWEIPFYLTELLGEVSVRYIGSQGNTFDTLVYEIEDQGTKYDHVLYLTVNYDLFMERALGRFYGISFDGLFSYVPSKLNWSLIKLHGSVNWGKKIKNSLPKNEDILTALNSLDSDLKLEEEITVFQDHQYVEQQGHQNFFPALAIPEEGKKDFVCMEDQVTRAESLIETCTDLLIIGFSALDRHVVNLFQGARNVEKLRIVNGEEKDGKDASRKFVSVNRKFYSRSGTVYPGGFGQFVASGDLRKFLIYD